MRPVNRHSQYSAHFFLKVARLKFFLYTFIHVYVNSINSGILCVEIVGLRLCMNIKVTWAVKTKSQMPDTISLVNVRIYVFMLFSVNGAIAIKSVLLTGKRV